MQFFVDSVVAIYGLGMKKTEKMLSAIFVIMLSQNLLRVRLITLFSSILLIITISLFNPTAKE